MLYELFVSYKGDIYTNGLSPLAKQLSGIYETISITPEEDKIEYEIAKNCFLEESEDLLKLTINNILFNIDKKTFREEYFSSYEFNKLTLEGKIDNVLVASEEPTSYWTHAETKNKICRNSTIYLIDYICKVSEYNPKVRDFIRKNTSLFARNFSRLTGCCKLDIIDLNLLKFVTTNLTELEKLITSNNEEYLLDLLKTIDAKLEKGKKLSQVISLPKFALDFMNENELIAAKSTIQKIANEFDGNTLKILIDTMNCFIPYEKYDAKENRYNSKQIKKRTFFENIYQLLTRKYKIVDLLNYLLKQRMYWSDSTFEFPYEEAKTLMDYISICEKNGLKAEKYPQNLTKYHNIVIKNISVLNSDDKKKENFKLAVKGYYSSEIEIGDYVFIAPSTIEELVYEGDELHHCIGNYSDSIINGISRIYFMRKKEDKKSPFVTLELNNTNDLVEFKGDYNKEPTDSEVIKTIKDFVKKTKKTAGGI